SPATPFLTNTGLCYTSKKWIPPAKKSNKGDVDIMARISQTTIDRLEELDLADFAMQLGDQLKREGRHYYTYRNGGEKTPSLCITPEKRMWTAFGSTESGFGA